MGENAGHGIEPESLVPGRIYRVDHRHVRLRRTFRMVGSYVGMETRPPAEPGGEPLAVLVFEVKPRFGKPGRQIVDVTQIQLIEEP